jgi:hypothetical protein
MADSVEVHFETTNKTKLRTVFTPGGKVKAVVILPKGPENVPGTRSSFAKANGLKLIDPASSFPPEVQVKKKENNDSVQLKSSDPGPGVCYWVEDGPEKTLVCW